MRFAGRAVALVACGVLLAACGGQGAGPTTGASLGPVTPAPEPGAFTCPTQVLASSPLSSRLVGVRVTEQEGFDRVAFVFGPSPADKPAENSGLIVRPVGVLPPTDADGHPLTVDGQHFIEVRFRDMALTGEDGGPAFQGDTDLKRSTGSVREVVQIEADSLALDWLIGATSDCARAWFDATANELLVDVQH